MTKTILLSVLAAVIWSTAILFAQEQAPAPVHKEGDTWQFNIFRKGQIGTSTELNEGMYEVSVTQGVGKLYQVDGLSGGINLGLVLTYNSHALL